MNIFHYSLVGALKIATVTFSLIGAAIVVLDPSVKLALIAGGPGMATGIGLIIVKIIDHRENRRQFNEGVRQFNILHEGQTLIAAGNTQIAKSVDGIHTKMALEQSERTAQLIATKDQLTDTAQQLSHEHGRREGREAAEAKSETQASKDLSDIHQKADDTVQRDILNALLKKDKEK